MEQSEKDKPQAPVISLGHVSLALGLFNYLVTQVANYCTFFPQKYGHLYDHLALAKGNPGPKEYLYSLIFCLFFLLLALVICQVAPLVAKFVKEPKRIIRIITLCFSGVKGAVNFSKKIIRKELTWAALWSSVKNVQYVNIVIAVGSLLFSLFALRYQWAIPVFLLVMCCVVAGINFIDMPSRVLLCLFLLLAAAFSWSATYIPAESNYSITVTPNIQGVGELSPQQFEIVGNRLVFEDGSGGLKSIPLNSSTMIINMKKIDKKD